VAGYFDALRRLLAHAMAEGFARREHEGLLLPGETPAAFLDAFAVWRPPAAARAWLAPSQS
jgi:hypothetical protein